MQTVVGRSYSVGSENDPEVRMEREVSVLTYALYWSDVPSKHNTRVLPDNIVFITSRGCRKLPPHWKVRESKIQEPGPILYVCSTRIRISFLFSGQKGSYK